MALTLAFLCLFFAFCICAMLVGVARAPFGFEDEEGFHTMRPVKYQDPEPILALSRRSE